MKGKRPLSEAHQKLLAIQKRIFQSLHREADRLLGEKPEAIRRYEAEYQRDFRGLSQRLAPVQKPELIAAIRSHDVTWVGDFHTFPQAQRTALRLLREAVKPEETWFVGVEMIPSQFQKQLDAFQKGALTLEAFLAAIRYREEWGFPWKNYAPLLEWAREAGVRVIALNRPRALLRTEQGRLELAERDQWAAGIITDLLAPLKGPRRGSPARMVVLYGELHIGSHHLPHQLRVVSQAYLKRPLRSLMVHQNLDPLYWSLAREGREIETQVLKLRRNSYCVFSATPWAKIQSLVDWAEGGMASVTAGPAEGLHDAEDDFTEAAPDYLGSARACGAAIAEFVGVEAKGFESLHLRSIEDPDFTEWLREEDTTLTPLEHAIIESHILHNQRIYLPRSRVGFLGTPSPNGLAEIAALHLLKEIAGGRPVFRVGERDDFYRQAMDGCFGFFGSLILNPRRKCDLPADHARRLRELDRGTRGAFPLEKVARTLTLRVIRNPATRDVSVAMNSRSRAMGFATAQAARMVGSILAKRIHGAVVGGRLPIEAIRKAFLARVPSESDGAYEQRFTSLLEATHTHSGHSTKHATL